MLFDLKGRRRRVVQVTYVGLAVLMGGGLILSGIGSSASGGLLDALVGGDNNSSSDDAKKPLNNQVKAAEAKLRANPKDAAALATLVRAHFGLAGLEQDTDDSTGATTISDKGIAEMRKAGDAWKRYVATDPPKLDTGLAATAIQIYRVIGLPQSQNDKNELVVAPARAIAEQENSVDAYIRLVAVATQAGDTRTAGLAERKALTFAKSKDEEATIKERIASEKEAASQQASGAGGNGAAPPTSGP
jgi:hypothetical protein